VSETRIVSPMPSSSSAPMPIALLMRPSSPSPASVTPMWNGGPFAFQQARREQSVGVDRHLRVAGLHAEHHVAEALVLAHVEELEGALHHAPGRVAEAVEDAVGEGAVVGADAQRPAERTAAPHQRPEAQGHALDLFRVLRVAVLSDLELLLVREVARIDPDLLDVLRRHQGGAGRVVDVGDEWHAHAPTRELRADLRQVLRLLEGGRRDAHDLATGIHEPLHLVGGARGVERVGRGHRLHADRVLAAECHVAHVHHAREASPRCEEVRRVRERHSAGPWISSSSLAKAASTRLGSLPPAWAKSGRPPPLPPTTAATSRTRSPAR
jgi:hypothetical protein